ncbi:hypothetical protein BFW87_10895 [Pseudomonas fluorescens]|uniref:ATP-grasp domain-containing protein n=1 Tax=Pseudomonas fluorescens TaxID=294 RepID=A0A1T2YWS8_PSEFL|nr:ATP-grasp domain-containing protein [Pseudomonas fluorescens]OPA96821.1 hypothetical protein BFW87_10895 [Pseudomonas fluorescens]
MDSKPTVLLLGPTDDYLKKVEAKAFVILITEPARVTPYQRGLVDPDNLLDFNDVNALVRRALELQRQFTFDGVYSFTELGMECASILASVLEVPGPDLHCSFTCRDKLMTRQALERRGLNTVGFEWVRPGDIDEPWIASGKKVLKPVDGTGSVGVRIIEEGGLIGPPSSRCILEDYVEGREFSCETFSIDGQHFKLAVTEKRLSQPCGVVEVGHVIDPAQTFISAAQWGYLQQILDAIGLRNGPGHIEFKLHDEAIHIIECHNRPGGDRIWSLVEIATGFDMVSASIDRLLGTPVEVQLLNRRCAAIHYFEYLPGTVRHCQAWQGSLPADIHWLDWKLSPGMVIAPMTNSSDRYGSFIVSAGSRTELLERITEVEQQFEVEIA